MSWLGDNLPRARDKEMRSTTMRAGWHWITVKLYLEDEARKSDVPPCKSTEVREQCFNARKSEQNASQGPPSIGPVPYKVIPGIVGRESFQDSVVEFGQVLDELISELKKDVYESMELT